MNGIIYDDLSAPVKKRWQDWFSVLRDPQSMQAREQLEDPSGGVVGSGLLYRLVRSDPRKVLFGTEGNSSEETLTPRSRAAGRCL